MSRSSGSSRPTATSRPQKEFFTLLSLSTSLDHEVSCKASESTTRSIRATPPTSRRLRAYYFWTGLQEADKPRRVSVEHKGRGPRQCPHCLKTSFDTFPCSFNAKGSACKKHGAKRTSLAQYNKVLREQDGYQSLRQLMLSSQPLMQTRSSIRRTTSHQLSSRWRRRRSGTGPRRPPRRRHLSSFKWEVGQTSPAPSTHSRPRSHSNSR